MSANSNNERPIETAKDNRMINLRLTDYPISYDPTAPANMQAAALLGKIAAPLSEAERLEKRKAELERTIKLKKGYAKNIFMILLGIAMFVGGICYGIFYAFPEEAKGNYQVNILPFFLGIMFGVIVFFIGTLKFFLDRNKYKSASRELPKLMARLVHLYYEIDWRPIAIVPPDYRFSYAAEFISKALLNVRASNMKEAVNLFEQEMHHNQMMLMQYQILATAQAAQRAAEIAAL